jgi:hypothetical protein
MARIPTQHDLDSSIYTKGSSSCKFSPGCVENSYSFYALNLLHVALLDTYNKTNDVKCNITINQENDSELEINLTIKNTANHSIRTPITHGADGHWITNFELLVFDEYTKEFITTIANGIYQYNSGKDIVLAPNEQMMASFRDVLSFIDAENLKDVIFVACSVPSEKIERYYCENLVNMETDPFKWQFWAKTVWKISEFPWQGTKFVSNAIKTSEEFLTY